MEATGTIEYTAQYSDMGELERVDFAWKGGDVVAIDYRFLDIGPPFVLVDFVGIPVIGDRLRVGPFALRVFEAEPYRLLFYAVRERRLITSLRVLWYRFGRVLDIAYRRLIRTLAIWKLAEYNAAVIPTWRDVYALKWLCKK